MTIDNYSDEELLKLFQYGEAVMTPQECALLLDIPIEDNDIFIQVLTKHHSHELYRAYSKGKLHTKIELHNKLIQLAKAGSPAAQPIVLHLLQTIE